MKTGRTLQQLAVELERQLETKKDFIADTRNIRMINGQDFDLHIPTRAGISRQTMAIRELAHDQIATRLSIPKVYYDRMRKDATALLDTNVNHWFNNSHERRMLRTIDGQVRAFLSDRYRPLDNYDLAEVVLPVIQKQGCSVESCELTEKRLYIKAVNARIQTEVVPGDIVQAGVVISNSEVGCGSVRIEPLVYRLVCKNGLIANDMSMKKYHVGRGADGFGNEENVREFLKDATRKADDKAFWMKVRDIVSGSLNEAMFNQIVDKMRKAKGVAIEGDPVEVVEIMAKKHTLNDGEKTNVLRFLIQGGDLSLYGMINAVTRASQECEDYDRATEMERLGGQILQTASLN